MRERYFNFPKSREEGCILYWADKGQRISYNFTLKKAIEISNKRDKILYVIFSLKEYFKEENIYGFQFLLEGLMDFKENLRKRKIEFILLEESIETFIRDNLVNIDMVLYEKGYLKDEKRIRKKIQKLDVEQIEIDNNLIIPVEIASIKEEYSAKTFRDKVTKIKEKFLKRVSMPKYNLNKKEVKLNYKKIELEDFLEDTHYEFIGGEKEGKKRLKKFIENYIRDYSLRGPDKDVGSKLSPYLHFGQISPIDIYLKVEKYAKGEEGKEFLEELFIRRELAHNFVYYNEDYNKWEGITYKWAYETLEKHKKDKREYVYSLEELEEGKTHDKYWNGAQYEMKMRGYLNSYMRMYWCKKILEWTINPKVAYERAIYLNNKYFIDGNNPNSYCGVAWCFGKHDRPWQEREVYGKVRYMNNNGLERKYNMKEFLERVELLKK